VDNGFLMRLQVLYSSFGYFLCLVFLSSFFVSFIYKEIIEVWECWNNGFNVMEARLFRHGGSSLISPVSRYLSEV